MYKACTHKKIMKYGMFGVTFLLEDHITPQSAHSMKSYSYQLWKMRCHLKCFQKMNSGYLRFFPDLMDVFVIKYICVSMASHLVQLAITGASVRQRINSKNQKFRQVFYSWYQPRDKYPDYSIGFSHVVFYQSFLV